MQNWRTIKMLYQSNFYLLLVFVLNACGTFVPNIVFLKAGKNCYISKSEHI